MARCMDMDVISPMLQWTFIRPVEQPPLLISREDGIIAPSSNTEECKWEASVEKTNFECENSSYKSTSVNTSATKEEDGENERAFKLQKQGPLSGGLNAGVEKEVISTLSNVGYDKNANIMLQSTEKVCRLSTSCSQLFDNDEQGSVMDKPKDSCDQNGYKTSDNVFPGRTVTTHPMDSSGNECSSPTSADRGQKLSHSIDGHTKDLESHTRTNKGRKSPQTREGRTNDRKSPATTDSARKSPQTRDRKSPATTERGRRSPQTREGRTKDRKSPATTDSARKSPQTRDRKSPATTERGRRSPQTRESRSNNRKSLATTDSARKSSQTRDRRSPATTERGRKSSQTRDRKSPATTDSARKSSQTRDRKSPATTDSARKSSQTRDRKSPARTERGRKSSQTRDCKSPATMDSARKSSQTRDRKSPATTDSARKSSQTRDRKSPATTERGRRSPPTRDRQPPVTTERDRRSPPTRDRQPPVTTERDRRSAQTRGHKSPATIKRDRRSAQTRDRKSPTTTERDRRSAQTRDRKSSATTERDRRSAQTRDRKSPATIERDRRSAQTRDRKSPATTERDRRSAQTRDRKSPATIERDRRSAQTRDRKSPATIESDRRSAQTRDRKSPATIERDRRSAQTRDRKSPATIERDRRSAQTRDRKSPATIERDRRSAQTRDRKSPATIERDRRSAQTRDRKSPATIERDRRSAQTRDRKSPATIESDRRSPHTRDRKSSATTDRRSPHTRDSRTYECKSPVRTDSAKESPQPHDTQDYCAQATTKSAYSPAKADLPTIHASVSSLPVMVTLIPIFKWAFYTMPVEDVIKILIASKAAEPITQVGKSNSQDGKRAVKTHNIPSVKGTEAPIIISEELQIVVASPSLNEAKCIAIKSEANAGLNVALGDNDQCCLNIQAQKGNVACTCWKQTIIDDSSTVIGNDSMLTSGESFVAESDWTDDYNIQTVISSDNGPHNALSFDNCCTSNTQVDNIVTVIMGNENSQDVKEEETSNENTSQVNIIAGDVHGGGIHNASEGGDSSELLETSDEVKVDDENVITACSDDEAHQSYSGDLYEAEYGETGSTDMRNDEDEETYSGSSEHSNDNMGFARSDNLAVEMYDDVSEEYLEESVTLPDEHCNDDCSLEERASHTKRDRADEVPHDEDWQDMRVYEGANSPQDIAEKQQDVALTMQAALNAQTVRIDGSSCEWENNNGAATDHDVLGGGVDFDGSDVSGGQGAKCDYNNVGKSHDPTRTAARDRCSSQHVASCEDIAAGIYIANGADVKLAQGSSTSPSSSSVTTTEHAHFDDGDEPFKLDHASRRRPTATVGSAHAQLITRAAYSGNEEEEGGHCLISSQTNHKQQSESLEDESFVGNDLTISKSEKDISRDSVNSSCNFTTGKLSAEELEFKAYAARVLDTDRSVNEEDKQNELVTESVSDACLNAEHLNEDNQSVQDTYVTHFDNSDQRAAMGKAASKSPDTPDELALRPEDKYPCLESPFGACSVVTKPSNRPKGNQRRQQHWAGADKQVDSAGDKSEHTQCSHPVGHSAGINVHGIDAPIGTISSDSVMGKAAIVANQKWQRKELLQETNKPSETSECRRQPQDVLLRNENDGDSIQDLSNFKSGSSHAKNENLVVQSSEQIQCSPNLCDNCEFVHPNLCDNVEFDGGHMSQMVIDVNHKHEHRIIGEQVHSSTKSYPTHNANHNKKHIRPVEQTCMDISNDESVSDGMSGLPSIHADPNCELMDVDMRKPSSRHSTEVIGSNDHCGRQTTVADDIKEASGCDFYDDSQKDNNGVAKCPASVTLGQSVTPNRLDNACVKVGGHYGRGEGMTGQQGRDQRAERGTGQPQGRNGRAEDVNTQGGNEMTTAWDKNNIYQDNNNDCKETENSNDQFSDLSHSDDLASEYVKGGGGDVLESNYFGTELNKKSDGMFRKQEDVASDAEEKDLFTESFSRRVQCLNSNVQGTAGIAQNIMHTNDEGIIMSPCNEVDKCNDGSGFDDSDYQANFENNLKKGRDGESAGNISKTSSYDWNKGESDFPVANVSDFSDVSAVQKVGDVSQCDFSKQYYDLTCMDGERTTGRFDSPVHERSVQGVSSSTDSGRNNNTPSSGSMDEQHRLHGDNMAVTQLRNLSQQGLEKAHPTRNYHGQHDLCDAGTYHDKAGDQMSHGRSVMSKSDDGQSSTQVCSPQKLCSSPDTCYLEVSSSSSGGKSNNFHTQSAQNSVLHTAAEEDDGEAVAADILLEAQQTYNKHKDHRHREHFDYNRYCEDSSEEDRDMGNEESRGEGGEAGVENNEAQLKQTKQAKKTINKQPSKTPGQASIKTGKSMDVAQVNAGGKVEPSSTSTSAVSTAKYTAPVVAPGCSSKEQEKIQTYTQQPASNLSLAANGSTHLQAGKKGTIDEDTRSGRVSVCQDTKTNSKSPPLIGHQAEMDSTNRAKQIEGGKVIVPSTLPNIVTAETSMGDNYQTSLPDMVSPSTMEVGSAAKGRCSPVRQPILSATSPDSGIEDMPMAEPGSGSRYVGSHPSPYKQAPQAETTDTISPNLNKTQPCMKSAPSSEHTASGNNSILMTTTAVLPPLPSNLAAAPANQQEKQAASRGSMESTQDPVDSGQCSPMDSSTDIIVPTEIQADNQQGRKNVTENEDMVDSAISMDIMAKENNNVIMSELDDFENNEKLCDDFSTEDNAGTVLPDGRMEGFNAKDNVKDVSDRQKEGGEGEEKLNDINDGQKEKEEKFKDSDGQREVCLQEEKVSMEISSDVQAAQPIKSLIKNGEQQVEVSGVATKTLHTTAQKLEQEGQQAGKYQAHFHHTQQRQNIMQVSNTSTKTYDSAAKLAAGRDSFSEYTCSNKQSVVAGYEGDVSEWSEEDDEEEEDDRELVIQARIEAEARHRQAQRELEDRKVNQLVNQVMGNSSDTSTYQDNYVEPCINDDVAVENQKVLEAMLDAERNLLDSGVLSDVASGRCVWSNNKGYSSDTSYNKAIKTSRSLDFSPFSPYYHRSPATTSRLQQYCQSLDEQKQKSGVNSCPPPPPTRAGIPSSKSWPAGGMRGASCASSSMEEEVEDEEEGEGDSSVVMEAISEADRSLREMLGLTEDESDAGFVEKDPLPIPDNLLASPANVEVKGQQTVTEVKEVNEEVAGSTSEVASQEVTEEVAVKEVTSEVKGQETTTEAQESQEIPPEVVKDIPKEAAAEVTDQEEATEVADQKVAKEVVVQEVLAAPEKVATEVEEEAEVATNITGQEVTSPEVTDHKDSVEVVEASSEGHHRPQENEVAELSADGGSASAPVDDLIDQLESLNLKSVPSEAFPVVSDENTTPESCIEEQAHTEADSNALVPDQQQQISSVIAEASIEAAPQISQTVASEDTTNQPQTSIAESLDPICAPASEPEPSAAGILEEDLPIAATVPFSPDDTGDSDAFADCLDELPADQAELVTDNQLLDIPQLDTLNTPLSEPETLSVEQSLTSESVQDSKAEGDPVLSGTATDTVCNNQEITQENLTNLANDLSSIALDSQLHTEQESHQQSVPESQVLVTPVEPAAVEEAPLPATVEKAPLPAATEEAHLPAAAEEAQLPAATEEAPLPAAVEETPLPAAAEETHLPAAAEEAPLPAAVEETPLPAAAEETHLLAAAEEAPLPAVAEEAPLPAAVEEAPLPAATEEAHLPAAAEEAPLPAAAEETHLPAAAEEAPLPAAVEETPLPAAAEEAPLPAAAEEAPLPAAAEEAPLPAAAEETPVPATTEEAPLPVAEDDLPIVPKASYNIDWDNFDEASFNPFGSSKAPVTTPEAQEPQVPVTIPEPQEQVPVLETQEPVSVLQPQESLIVPEPQDLVTVPENQEPVTVPEPQEPVFVQEPQEPVTVPELQEPVTVPAPEQAAFELEAPLPAAAEEAPLPVTAEEAPLPAATEEAPLPVTAEEAPLPAAAEEATLPIAEDDLPIVPKASYSIDWDNFDEDSFNPFGTSKALGNSPPRGGAIANSPPIKSQTQIKKKSPAIKKPVKKVTPVKKISPVKKAASPVVEPIEATPIKQSNQETPIAESVPSPALIKATTPVKESAKATPKESVDPLPAISMDEEPVAASDPEEIPIPKASYQIDWDNLDENTNPFGTTKRLSNSPPTKDTPPVMFDEDADPFKPRRAMANSPQGSPRPQQKQQQPTAEDVNENLPPVTNDTQPETNNNVDEQPQPKKVIKKKPTGPTGVKSRFKRPPKIVNKSADDDVMIMLPENPPSKNAEAPTSERTTEHPSEQPSEHPENEDFFDCAPAPSAAPVDERDGLPPPQQDAQEDFSHPTLHAQMMAQQKELRNMHLDDDDEFKPASEVFSDPAAWDMLEKCGASNHNESVKESALARQSLYVKFDPLVKGSNSPAGLQKRLPLSSRVECISEEEAASAAGIGEDLLLMSTPPAKRLPPGGQQSRHPALRALDNAQQHHPQDNHASNVDRMYAHTPTSLNNATTPTDNHSNTSSTNSMLPAIPSEMTDSRELTAEPINQMSSSWLENVKFYSELEGDTALLNSADSVDCMNWNTRDSGRPESPLQFDHEEILGISTISSSAHSEHRGTTSTTAVHNDDTAAPAVDSGKPSSGSSGGSPTGPSKHSPNNGAAQDGVDMIQVLKYSQVDFDRSRREWELDSQARFLAKERDWLLKYDTQEEDKKRLQAQIDKLEKSHDKMKGVMSEYETAMTHLIERGLIRTPEEKNKKSSATQEEVVAVIKERDQALEDLQSVETAFADLHRRYEKIKGMVESFRKNEDTLKKCVADYQGKLKKQEERYQTLKKHAEERLELAMEEVDKTKKSTEQEVMRLRAALKRSELQCASLEQQVEQKTQQNKDLSSICDELINKVG